MERMTKQGAVIGLLVGLIALLILLAIVFSCLPWHISSPTSPWPWYCSDPIYTLLGYVAFPVNLLTNDMARAVLLSPLSLLLYTVLGGLIGKLCSLAKG